MAGPGASWSVLDGYGRTLAVQPGPAPRPGGAGRADPGGPALAGAGGRNPAGVEGSFALTVCRTLPPAFSAQVVSVTEAPDGTVSMALNSGITVLLGTDDDLPAKYEDVAAIIAHGSLHGATTIDVTVPQSPTVTG